MIKITKPGVIPPPKPEPIYTGTCSFCGCEVEVNTIDVIMQGRRGYVICPTPNCKQEINLSGIVVNVRAPANVEITPIERKDNSKWGFGASNPEQGYGNLA